MNSNNTNAVPVGAIKPMTAGALLVTAAVPPIVNLSIHKRCFVHMDQHKAGQRIPAINWKLNDLFLKCQVKPYEFRFLQGDVAVEVLGNYNPLYAGRPKRLALALLNALAGDVRKGNHFYLFQAGLGYAVPPLIGVRSERLRVSAAGLALLDHWAEKFPKFKPFLLAYDNKKARKVILSECFDLAMGVRPASFAKIDERNVDLKIKWEAREYRRIKKEEKERAEKQVQYVGDVRTMLLQQQSLQQQSLTDYQKLTFQQSQTTAKPLWCTNLFGSSTT